MSKKTLSVIKRRMDCLLARRESNPENHEAAQELAALTALLIEISDYQEWIYGV